MSKPIWKLLFQMQTAKKSWKPQTQWQGTQVRTTCRRGVWGIRKAQGQLRLPPPTLPQRQFTGHSTPVLMASLIRSDYKIFESKDCVFCLYIYFFYHDIYPHNISQNVSWINVELMNEQIKGKIYKQIKCNNSKKQQRNKQKTLKCFLAMERVRFSFGYKSKHSPTHLLSDYKPMQAWQHLLSLS